MISLRLGLLSVGACLLTGGEAFGLLQSRGLILQTARRSPSRSLAPKGRSALGQRCSVAMEVNPREDADFEMTVDWDEELRKLNASEYGKRRADRDLTKDIDDPEALKWAKSNANKAQSAVQETSYKVRGAMQKAPRWQQLSRDYRFWLGLVVALSLLSSILSASGRSQDLVVWNDALGRGDEAAQAFAYVALVAATTAHAAGDVASQLAETGASMVFV